MKAISTRLENKLLETVIPPFTRKVFVYKKFLGEAVTFDSTTSISLVGDATDFFSAGDTIIFSHVEGIEEYTIDTATYHSSPKATTIVVVSGGSAINVQDGSNDAYCYKKHSIDVDLLKNGIGDISYKLEGTTLNEFNCSDVVLQVENGNEVYWDEANKTGVFYRNAIAGDFSAVSGLTLTDIEFQNYEVSLKGYWVEILSGEKIGEKYIILTHTAGSDTVTLRGTPVTDGVAVGDNYRVMIEHDYIIQIEFGVTGYTEANEKFNVFGGILYGENIKYNFSKRIVQLRIHGFFKDLEREDAYETADLQGSLRNFHGKLIDYGLGEAKYVRYGVKELSYKFAEEEIIKGCTLKRLEDRTTDGIKVLAFKRLDYFKWNKGSWTQKDTTETSNLIGEDNEDLSVAFSVDDYTYQNALEYVSVEYNEQEGSKLKTEKKGIATIEFDEGGLYTIYTEFFRIWQCDTHPTGTDEEYAPPGSTFYPEEDQRPIQLFDATSGGALYFGSISKFNSFRIEGLVNSTGTISGLWYYSKASGTATTGWTYITVTDGTSGLTQDGTVSFTVPEDWEERKGIGAEGDYGLYYIKFVPSSSPHTVTVARVIPRVYVQGQHRDWISIEFITEKLTTESREETIVIRHDEDGDPQVASWQVALQAGELLENLLQKAGYSLGATYDDPKIKIDDYDFVNFWGRCPTESEASGIGAICHTGTYLYVAVRNTLYRIKDDIGFEEVYSLPWKYYITDLEYGTTSGEIHGIAYERYPEPYGYLAINYSQLYYGAPDSIAFIVSSPDAATPTMEYNEYVAGVQYSPYDNRWLIRSGWRWASTTTSGDYYPQDMFRMMGFIEVDGDMLQDDNEYVSLNENIVIPFPQVVMVCDYAVVSDNFTAPEIESAAFTLISSRWLGYIPANSTLDMDTYLPNKLSTGYYIHYAHWGGGSSVAQRESRREVGLRITYGQHGKAFWDKVSTIAQDGGGTIDVGWYTQTCPSTTGNLSREYRLINGDGEKSTPLAYSEGEYYNLPTKKMPRENLLSSCIGDIDSNEIISAVQKCRMGFCGYDPVTEDLEDWVNDGWIESNIVDTTTTSTNNFDPDRMDWWDNSAMNYYEVSFPNTYTLVADDAFVISGHRRFGRILIKFNTGALHNLSHFEFSFSWKSQEWRDLEGQASPYVSNQLHETLLDTTNGWLYFDYSIPEEWFKGWWIPDATYHYSIKVKYIGASTFPITGCTFKRKLLWENWHSDYSSINYGLMPTEIEYNPNDDRLYGTVLDRDSLEWHVFSLDCAGARAEDDSDNNMIISQSNIDETMLPRGFRYSSGDDKVYFIMTDPRNQEKGLKLFNVEYDSGIVITEKAKLYLGTEWDCPDKLATNGTTLYGATGPLKNYIWEYDDEAELRVPYADWGDLNCREAIAALLEIMGMTLIITSDRIAKIIKRHKAVSSAKELDSKYILSVDDIGQHKFYYDGTEISWAEKAINPVSGSVKTGIIKKGARLLSISNDYISHHSMALLIGETLFETFKKMRKEIKFKTIMLPIFELLDCVNINLPSVLNNVIDDSMVFKMTEIKISDKKKSIEITAVEEN